MVTHIGDSNKARLGVIACAILVGALCYPQWSLNHDTSWYLVATRLFLNGAPLYDYIGEVNPPLAFYLTAPPLFIADILGTDDTGTFISYTLFLAFASLAWCSRLANRAAISEQQRWALIMGLIAATLIMPLGSFGQREHLMLIATAPYFVAVMLRERRGASSPIHDAAIGAVATIGFALKPYFYIAAAAPALLVLLQTRRLRDVLTPANLCIVACTLAYAVAVWRFHPAYLEKIVPIARIVYGSFGKPIEEVLLVPALAAFLAVLFVALRRQAAIDDVARYILAIALGFLACYIWQFKGWSYQLVPFLAYAFLFAAWLSADLKTVRSDKFLAGALIICAICTLGVQLQRGPYRAALQSSFTPYVKDPRTPVLVLSTNVGAAFPFVNEVDGRWTSRYPAQWLPPGALKAWRDARCPRPGRRCADILRVIELARSTTVDDLIHNRPTLVFVDERPNKPYFSGQPFDYLDFLGGDRRFAAAWREFHLEGREAGFTIWRRKPDAASLRNPPTAVNHF